MKTKIRTFIIICTFGLVGVLNANATLSYIASCDGQALEEKRNVKSENLNSSEFNFNADTDFDYEKEAQLVTKWVADKEEAKAIQKLIDKKIFVSDEEADSIGIESKSVDLNSAEFGFNEDTKIDYAKEARLLTKWNADKEETKAIQRLIDDGKLVDNQ